MRRTFSSHFHVKLGFLAPKSWLNIGISRKIIKYQLTMWIFPWNLIEIRNMLAPKSQNWHFLANVIGYLYLKKCIFPQITNSFIKKLAISHKKRYNKVIHHIFDTWRQNVLVTYWILKTPTFNIWVNPHVCVTFLLTKLTHISGLYCR